MSSSKLTRMAVESTFKDVVNDGYILSLIRTFIRGYNLPKDEAWSAAGLGFSQAFQTFNPKLKVSFTTWMHWKVEGRLSDLVRERALAHVLAKRHRNGEILSHLPLQIKTAFDPSELFASLSPDGAEAVKLALNPSIPMKIAIKRSRYRRVDVARRTALRKFLKEQGWSDERIKQAFKNVRRSL